MSCKHWIVFFFSVVATIHLSHNHSNGAVFTAKMSGDWDANATWNCVGCAPGQRTPAAGDDVIINGETVSIDAAAAAASITVTGGGVLQWTADVSLALDGGGTLNVAADGTLSDNGGLGTLSFVDVASYNVVIDGVASVNNLSIDASQTVSLSGSSTLTVLNDLTIGADDVVLNNTDGKAELLDLFNFFV